MTAEVLRLIPQPTKSAPHKQITWLFEALGISNQALHWYLRFVSETNCGYEELAQDPRFYIDKYWEPDALLRFVKWLDKHFADTRKKSRQPGKLASRTRYAIYKQVRKAMDWSYSLGYIETIIYHAPMDKGASETNERSAYTEEEDAIIESELASWLTLAIKVAEDNYKPTGRGKPFRPRQIKEITNFDFDIEAPIEIDGTSYSNLKEAAKAFGWRLREPLGRLKRGYSVAEAFHLERRYADRVNEVELWALWMFENEFNCDPKAMLQKITKSRDGTKHGGRIAGVLGTDKLQKLFIKWGVWPYIDSRLIMPLACELCRLTGLNVEAIRSLTLDSYIESHPLTGQPCLVFEKPRSSSGTRSETRELHINLLNYSEHYVEEVVQEKVDFLIKLATKLTSRIRDRAKGDDRKKLFIFEDNDWNKLNRTDHVTSLFYEKPDNEDVSRGMALSVWHKWFRCRPELRGVEFNLSRFRPTLATRMILNGEDVFKLQIVLGHADISTTSQYLDTLQLQPKFNKEMSSALNIIAKSSDSDTINKNNSFDYEIGETVTLTGCGCKDAYNPSERVRKLTSHVEGSLCKYWNMCLLCDNSIITENSLPKLIAYRGELSEAIKRNFNTMKGRNQLYQEIISRIDNIIEPNELFPEEVIVEATYKANNLDSEMLDQLVYQGI